MKTVLLRTWSFVVLVRINGRYQKEEIFDEPRQAFDYAMKVLRTKDGQGGTAQNIHAECFARFSQIGDEAVEPVVTYFRGWNY